MTAVETFRNRERSEPAFRREPLPLPPGNSFVRMITAKAIATLQHRQVADVIAERWPDDRLIERAVSAPAMTNVAGWAQELAHKIVIDSLEALGPATAAVQVFQKSTVLQFNGAGIISAPGFVASAANASFVSEGQPIPVRQFPSTAVQLLPYKLAVIAVLTEEMVESGNAETLIGDTLLRSAAAALDAALFDTNPADATRPAGLRNGITALTASANTSAWDAYFEDARALVDAISTVGGDGPIVMVASPGRAIEMQLRAIATPGTPFYIRGSNAVGNDMIAIAPIGLVCAFDPDPDVESSNTGELHMDSAPQPVGSVGPARSLFQTRSLALKMRWPVSWALRDARAVAWLTPTWK